MTYNHITTLLDTTSSDLGFSDANTTNIVGIMAPIEPTTSGISVGKLKYKRPIVLIVCK